MLSSCRQPWARVISVFAGMFVLLFLGLAQVFPQNVLQATLSADELHPIKIQADEISTWSEGAEQIFLLRGKVLVEQGLGRLQMENGIAWYVESKKNDKTLCHVELYADGDDKSPVILEQGSEKRNVRHAFIKLKAFKVELKSYQRKIVPESDAANPVVARARAARAAAGNPPRSGVVQAAATAPVAGTIQQTQGTAIPGLDPAAQPPPVVPAPGPAPVPGVDAPPSTFPDSLPPPPPPPPTALPAPTPGGPITPSGAPELLSMRQVNIRPRSSQEIQAIKKLLPDGDTAIIVPTGVIITVTNPREGKILVDIEADRLVFWTKQGDTQQFFENMKSPRGENSRALEFFLSGNVEIRNQLATGTQVIRAQDIYYDVNRNVAVGSKGQLEMTSPRTQNPIIVKAEELLQLGPKVFQGKQVQVFSSELPSDPGITVDMSEATLTQIDTPRQNIFGRTIINLATGQPLTKRQNWIEGRNTVVRLESFPILYLPYYKTDAEDPLGPLDAVNFNYNNIFGFMFNSTWDIFDLIGVVPDRNTRWKLYADYLSRRGPALGTQFNTAGTGLFGIPNRYEFLVKAYGIHDDATDILGGDRGIQAYVPPPPPEPNNFVPITHPDWRGRALFRGNVYDLPEGFTFQSQVSLISDQNFLEQYFYQEWNSDINQETFGYLKQQQDIWAWTLLAEPRLRDWITETEWLPRADGYVLGLKLFDDLLTYNTHASIGYARLLPTDVPSFAYLPTDVRVDTGRADWWNEVSLPFGLGAFKLVPYLVGDLAYYTNDVNGDSLGRLYGAAGLRGSFPLSRYYPEIQSELFNLNGIFHKMVFSGNYYYARSSTEINEVPQLDRFNDDASDQALRDIYYRQQTLNPNNAAFLTTSSLFDPQYYALRRLIDNRVDTLGSINVFQMDLRQRWQTKRGFPGREHVVDWMTLDLGASVFPQPDRDNYGQVFGILQYDWVWNIGDRTALLSSGWAETVDGGPRVFSVGATTNRPDGTNFYLGYRQIDPLESKAVVASVTYAFSAKYAATASTIYDFGIESQTNTIMLTRMGTDLLFSLGFSYNSILDNYGVIVQIVPRIAARNQPGRYGMPVAAMAPAMSQ